MGDLLTPKEAFPNGPAVQTLANWRVQGKGPKFTKVGRKVYYDADELAAWRRANTFSSTSEAEAA